MYMLGENFIDLFFSDFVHTILSADYLFLWSAAQLLGPPPHIGDRQISLLHKKFSI